MSGLLVVGLVVLLAYPAFGGSTAKARFVVPAPGNVTGSLQPLSPAEYELWVTPDLFPGTPSVDIDVQGANWSSSYTGPPYAGAGVPISYAESGWVRAPVPYGADPNDLLIVSSTVAAVRVGNIGTAAPQSIRGLPPGEKVLAFRVPQIHTGGGLLQAPEQTLTVINHRGEATKAFTPSTHRSLPPPSAPPQAWTSRGGDCAVASALPGLTSVQTIAATKITPVATGAPGLFLSCLDDRYAFHGAKFNVAILLNAHHPGQRPTALWGTTAVQGHPGLVVIQPPPQFATGENVTSPMFARRVRDAWLVVQARPGFARNPGRAQTISVLTAIHITRIDLTHDP
jgi:hypothetical protein